MGFNRTNFILTGIMAVLLLATVSLISLIVYLWMKYHSINVERIDENIPTVKSWPIIGSGLQMNSRRPDLHLLAWAKQLGPIYKVKVFHETWVVVSGYDAMYEMLVTKGNAFGGRFNRFLFDSIFAKKDIAFGDLSSAHWLPVRKAAHRGIRHYGDGMARMEQTLSDMTQAFIHKLRSYDNCTVDLRNDIYYFFMKVAVTMLSGLKLSNDDHELLTNMKTMEQLTTAINFTRGLELDMFPWLKYILFPVLLVIRKVVRLRDRLWEEMWRHSQRTYSPTRDASCILHAIAQVLDSTSRYYDSGVDMEHARAMFLDLILGSIGTTSNFTYALPNILLHHPQVMHRLQQEVDTVLGPGKFPSIFDRDAMPYAVATINELLRYASLFTNAPHVATENTSLAGFHIPAGTVCVPVFSGVLYDQSFWADPDIFRPERFLDDRGNLLPADHPVRKHMIQFGAGPRMCVGETFALKHMFMFLTSLVQAFDLLPGEGCLVPCDYQSHHKFGVVNHPRTYTITLRARRTA